MSGKAEFDEPLSVDGSCHVFKDFDAAGVVFDEVVVGAEDGGDFALGGQIGNRNFNFLEIYNRNLWLC